MGIQKLFGAVASGGERRTKTLNWVDNRFFSFLYLKIFNVISWKMLFNTYKYFFIVYEFIV